LTSFDNYDIIYIKSRKEGGATMKKWIWRIILSIIIIGIVTLVSVITQQNWVGIFYSTILALFTPEIKEFIKCSKKKQIRLSYSYLFRIQVNGNYLLVKDAQGRDQYQPVGGVYKYDSEKLDLEELCDGVYDNVFNGEENLTDDLRIIVSKKKLKKFTNWFKTGILRENLTNLGREFKEELIDSNIIDKNLFSTINYEYIGSTTQKSFNQDLGMEQIRHFDIVKLTLTFPQSKHLSKLISKQSDKYIFATKDHIERGCIQYCGKRYKIANHSKLILVDPTLKLEKESEITKYSTDICLIDNNNIEKTTHTLLQV